MFILSLPLLQDKFNWIVDELIEKHPDTTLSAAKSFYYGQYVNKFGEIKLYPNIMITRNQQLEQLIRTPTAHQGTKEKLMWVYEQMKSKYSDITFGVVWAYHYDHMFQKEMSTAEKIKKRNKRIAELLNREVKFATLNERFSWIAAQLLPQFPDITPKKVWVFYYSHYVEHDK